MPLKLRTFLQVVILIFTLMPPTSSQLIWKEWKKYETRPPNVDQVIGVNGTNSAGTVIKNLRLLQVQEVWRHGDRTAPRYCPDTDTSKWWKRLTDPHPYFKLPKYQFRNSTTGLLVENPVDNDKEETLPGGARVFGLTRLGMHECYHVGESIRIRYRHKFPLDDKYFQKNNIELFTSNYQRTKLCLAYAMAGVFQKREEEPEKYEPLTFNLLDSLLTRDHLKDSVTWNNWKKFCEAHSNDLVYAYQVSSDTIAVICNKTIPPPYWLLSGVTDMMVSWKANLLDKDKNQPVNTMASYLLRMLPVLEVQSHRLHLAKYIGDERFGINLRNLTGQPLIKKIISNMHSFIQGSEKEMIFYSGHDVTLIPLMSIIGSPPETALPFGASLTFELYQESKLGFGWFDHAIGLYYIRLKYHGGDVVRSTPYYHISQFERLTDQYTDPEVGCSGCFGCKNANFTIRARNEAEDGANPHCHGEKCIDVHCPVQ